MKSLVIPAIAFASLSIAGNLSAQDYWGDAAAATTAGAAAGATGGYAYADPGSGYADSGSGFSGLLSESDFSYGYLDGSYYWFDFDEDNFDSAHGFGAGLSVALIDTLFVKGNLNYATSKTLAGDDIDYLDWQTGVGIGLPMMNRFDLVLEGGLAHRSIEVDGFNTFDNLTDGYGWYVAPGVRIGVTKYLEISGTVRYISVDSASDVGIDVRALLHLTPSISVTGGVLFSDDANQYGAGLRINF